MTVTDIITTMATIIMATTITTTPKSTTLDMLRDMALSIITSRKKREVATTTNQNIVMEGMAMITVMITNTENDLSKSMDDRE